MSDDILRCFRCRKPLDGRGGVATVELNPMGNGSEGFHAGKLCSDCESDVAEKMKKTTGGNA